MSATTLNIDVTDGISPMINRVKAGLVDRSRLHGKIANDVHALLLRFFTRIALTKHATATALGAKPTGHFEKPENYITEQSDANAATLTIAKAGIGRATHDVTIKPGAGKKFLTIPLTAEAYGQRAYRMNNTFFLRSKAGKLFIARQNSGARGGSLVLLYLLVRSVFQKKDETLLPPMERIRKVAQLAAESYVDALVASGGARA